MEVVGVALAGVSLLATAAENYAALYQLFTTYRDHIKEAILFTTLLEVQRSIFQNQYNNLLLAIKHREPFLDGIIGEDLPDGLMELLGSSYGACALILTLINETLEKLAQETTGLYRTESKGNKKAFWSFFRQRMKFSFKKNRLLNIIDDLRRWNEDLLKLTNQTYQHKDIFQNQTPTRNKIALQHLEMTRDATRHLYDILAHQWYCAESVHHTARLELLMDEISLGLDPRVRFRLGFDCLDPPGTISPPPIWLAVESCPNYAQISQPGDQANRVLSRASVPSPRRVRIQIPGDEELIHASNRRIAEATDQQDLNAVGDLCHYMRNIDTAHSVNQCVGLLGGTTTFKHFVYHAERPLCEFSNTKTLKDLLQQAFDERQPYKWLDKLKLARILALSVLRFNSTSWLPKSWGSKDICFFERSTMETDMRSPHLHRQLIKDETSIEGHINNGSVVAANPELFSLAIVLIELGYDSPFDNISLIPPNLTTRELQLENFLAATRLAGKVHQRFNRIYGDLVERCLRCNFGVATTLDKAELQSAVLVHVVNQLDLCLEKEVQFQDW